MDVPGGRFKGRRRVAARNLCFAAAAGGEAGLGCGLCHSALYASERGRQRAHVVGVCGPRRLKVCMPCCRSSWCHSALSRWDSLRIESERRNRVGSRGFVLVGGERTKAQWFGLDAILATAPGPSADGCGEWARGCVAGTIE